jgi:hypothetical protein
VTPAMVVGVCDEAFPVTVRAELTGVAVGVSQ